MDRVAKNGDPAAKKLVVSIFYSINMCFLINEGSFSSNDSPEKDFRGVPLFIARPLLLRNNVDADP